MQNREALLQALRNSRAGGIFEAYKLLVQHWGEMRKEVYGPMLLEVNVSDRAHANYLEGQVLYYIWKLFITYDPHDRDLLVKSLKNYDVPILNYANDEQCAKEPFQVSEKMHELGINSRLDQVFDAPRAVKEVFISQSGLDRSYIGSKVTDHRADEVAKLDIYDFWTSENHYHWCKSKYGGHVSASVEPVNNSRLLLCSSDAGEIERLRGRIQELEESITALEGSFKLLFAEQRQLENEEAELQKERMIMAVIWKRINDTGKNWRHVYKEVQGLRTL